LKAENYAFAQKDSNFISIRIREAGGQCFISEKGCL
jgi:hypothetical protein